MRCDQSKVKEGSEETHLGVAVEVKVRLELANGVDVGLNESKETSAT